MVTNFEISPMLIDESYWPHCLSDFVKIITIVMIIIKEKHSI